MKKKIPIFLKVKAQSSFMNVLNYRVLHTMPWFANIVNFLATGDLPTHWSTQDKR
jgi:hypothetical protein